MVCGFLIHTISSVSALSAGGSRVLYSRVFGPEDNTEADPERRRLLQKERLLALARRVRTAVCLYRDAAGTSCVECVLGEEAVALGEAEFGVLRLSAGEPFPAERTVLWLGVQNLAFTLVCEMHENLLLAEGTLRNIARHCMEELRLLGPGSEILLKSDRIDALLHRYVPHGQLLFLNHRFTHILDKELSAYSTK
ncbi:AP-5 complex subunit sigma-1 [Clupea harengus]|uniref:AP-5 complex subunit sigma-1 n=1 Tax=Clupea harengus TaxID=7950 RepID=A0A6P3VVD4_CLUHA|nr:AP-5 complex subunit sigma-1 [Clupea harengus]XP_031436082.1 AP-5 complex subunit sigma-1 [Clupea harengus]